MDFGEHATTSWGKKYSFLQGYFGRKVSRIDPNVEFNNRDRSWRKKWLHAQVLSENDGKLDLYRNADYRKARFNIFRRVYRMPMDFVEFNIFSKIMPTWYHARALRKVCAGLPMHCLNV